MCRSLMRFDSHEFVHSKCFSTDLSDLNSSYSFIMGHQKYASLLASASLGGNSSFINLG